MITMREFVEAVDQSPEMLSIWMQESGPHVCTALTRAMGRWMIDSADPQDRLVLIPRLDEADLIQFALAHQIEVTFLAE